jgi:hypothetical protein
MADRIIISGEAGKRWTNDTDKVKYQYIAALTDTCGVCLQYHLKISAAWPIPIHEGCRCIQRMIKPGQVALHAFCDFRDLLCKMDQAGKHASIGAPSYALLESGLVRWEDIVTPNRVREFHEVVARKRFTVEQMISHGVNRAAAEEAYAMVHTPEHEGVERERRELLLKIAGAGVSQEDLVKALSVGLTSRVTGTAKETNRQEERKP